MAQAALLKGKIICIRCRRRIRGDLSECRLCRRWTGGRPMVDEELIGGARVGVWLFAAALTGSLVGAALSLMR